VSQDGTNIFSPQQEADLGDAVHEHLQSQYQVIEDDALNSYLARIGERLLRHMPASELRFRFLLSDVPVTDALSLPGGRIYLTRKLVASTRNEDELAGVLAHELGHGLAHDSAVSATRALKRALGITRLGDRKDVFDKYHQLLESAHRSDLGDRRREQVAADRAAFDALACAGYRPHALADWWDRFYETQGRTGSWLSDLVGTTRPEMRRLREMLRARVALPAASIEPRPAARGEEFRRWQAAVVAYSRREPREALDGVIWRRPLDPPLQPDIEHIRFSPDGRFALAQDDAGIFVLSRDPFAILFHVEAPDVAPAQFSPDSNSVVFHTRSLRVERWEIASGERVSVQEVVRREPCAQTALSPDARFLACYEAGSRLVLIEVDGGAEVLEKKPFLAPRPGLGFDRSPFYLDDEADSIRFSPDGRYLLAGALQASPLAFDLATRMSLNLPEVFRSLTLRSFAFLGGDRLAGVALGDPTHLALVRFPGGELMSRLPLNSTSRLAAASKGDYLLLRPLNKYPAAVMDLATGKVVLANKAPALDVHGDLLINQTEDGGLDLRRWSALSTERVGRIELPRGRLASPRAVGMSPDLKWLAVSERRRGAVWNLESGQRVTHVRAFLGASLDAAGVLYADFPAFEEHKRSIAKVDVGRGQMVDQRVVTDELGSAQLGDAMLTVRRDQRDRRRIAGLEAADTWSGARLWSREMPEAPFVLFVSTDGASIALAWPIANHAARDELRRSPAAKALLAALKQAPGGFLVEVMETRSGRTLGYAYVSSGIGRFIVSGEWLVVDDALGRALVYSLESGDLRGRLFAKHVALAPTGLLAAESAPGRMGVYDLASLEKRLELAFPSRVAFARFHADGKRLIVLTANQTAYLLDTERSPRPTARE
jgi:hypothetical protein